MIVEMTFGSIHQKDVIPVLMGIYVLREGRELPSKILYRTKMVEDEMCRIEGDNFFDDIPKTRRECFSEDVYGTSSPEELL